MAVEFISNGYDTTSTNPYTEGAWADAHPSIGLAKYGVRSPMHWKVTAVAGADRTVSIAAGKGFGHGITDYTYANETLQLDTIASGSRWDLIAVRRDWTPTAGVSKFVKINGGATPVIPGGRQSNAGGIDDQPLALVQVTAGQTQPTAIIDLRTWSGDGGVIVAAHDLVRTFMNSTGTRLWVDGIDWIRRVGANDTPEWVRANWVHAEFANTALLNSPVPAGGQLGPFYQTFPAGRFTVAPIVTLGVSNARLSASCNNPTKDGFELYIRNDTSADAISGAIISFTAKQMTATTAAG